MKRLAWILALPLLISVSGSAQSATPASGSQDATAQERMFFPRDMFWGWAQFDLALAYLLAGDYHRAAQQALVHLEGMRPAASESQEWAQAWSLIGIAYAHLNQGEQSINALRQAAALAPGDEEYLLNLTRELMELNRYPEAVAAVQPEGSGFSRA